MRRFAFGLGFALLVGGVLLCWYARSHERSFVIRNDQTQTMEHLAPTWDLEYAPIFHIGMGNAIAGALVIGIAIPKKDE